MLRILVDAMGGDNAPVVVVEGCICAVEEKEGFEILLIGDKKEINKVLSDRRFHSERIKVINTTEVISNNDAPMRAIRTKKDSSLVVGLKMLKENQADVFISAGNTGALMAGATFITGRIKGVDRPPLATFLPTKKGTSLLVDAGANTMCKPVNFLQFAIMGSLYMKKVLGVEKPTVGLINVGSENEKGSETIKKAFSLLSNSNLNFIGNIEGREITDGDVDIIVCDGFTGNVLLKFGEGMLIFILEKLKEVFSKGLINKICGILIKKELKKTMKIFDYNEYGAVPLLGVNKKVMKTHGSCNSLAIKNSVLRALDYGKSDIIEALQQDFKDMEVDEIV